jgi:hypothetical protein
MGLSPRFSVFVVLASGYSPDRLVSGSIGNEAEDGKRLRVIDALD